MTDVLVVGAGPAGTAAAITLARLGRQVTVVDRSVFPREKCCGDGLTAAALRRLEHLGLDPGAVASWQPVDQVMVVAVSGRRVELPLRPRGGGWLAVSARRIDLDAALVERARASGVEVIEGRTVKGVSSSGPAAVVQFDDGGHIEAPYVVAADGMWSPVRRSLGLTPPGYLGEWQAGRQYLEGTGPEARKLWVWFEPDLLPGYAWSFPLPDGRVNFGYGVLRASGTSFRGQRMEWRDRPSIAAVLGPDARESGPWRSWPIPARIGTAALGGLGGRVLFAGDAAGACDPMTGEGIAQALETGEVVARAIAQAGEQRPADALRRYGRVIRCGMALDDRLGRRLSGVLGHTGGSDAALRIVAATEWGRRHFGRWMFEDYPRAVVATPHRWDRHLLAAAGAYAHRVGTVGAPTTSFARHD